MERGREGEKGGTGDGGGGQASKNQRRRWASAAGVRAGRARGSHILDQVSFGK